VEVPGMRVVTVALLTCVAATAFAQDPQQDAEQAPRPGLAPDIREDAPRLTLRGGDFVVVPIPISNPTIGTGLVGGAAYFYPQTEEQKKVQPASMSGIGGMYTTSDSKALALFHQNYWKENKWRFTGGIGGADARLKLATLPGGEGEVNWRVYGSFAYLRLSHKIRGDWYAGGFLRYLDARQDLEIPEVDEDYDTGDVRSSGLGVLFENDARDMPINTYEGHYFSISALFNSEALGSNKNYQNYDAKFRSYHSLTDELVFAWEARGCYRDGTIPLYEACPIPLRGFNATQYLGKTSLSGQAELRWHFSKRWGVVGFGGLGDVGDSFQGLADNESTVPSYGLGVRFMVLESKRINVRVDYARSSNDSSAWHVSVGEAF
jgi:hypothetical protein